MIVRNQRRGVKTKFIVVRGHINSPPLLGKMTLIDLGMISISETGEYAEENELKIKAAKEDDRYRQLKEEFHDVFEGIGLIRDKTNDNPFYATFNMKEETAPVAQKARPVAYYLQEPLKKLLEKGVEDDVFERIPNDEPIEWCSPLVVQIKPKFTKRKKEELEPHMIRASIDMRVPNKYMERNRIAQNTIVEDFTHKFHNSKIFSKLDLNQGYNQLMLEPKCRSVATFSTPWGDLRPKRLILGAKASQDSFDDAMQRIFGDIPNCLNQGDDILVGGATREEYDRTLRQVLQRARDFGVTFSIQKCQMGVTDIEFYGYKFTKEGLKPTEEKVRAVKESRPPETKSEVRSFLGMTGYLSKFIPKYASMTEALRKLTQKDTKFHWGKQEQGEFERLKEAITSEQTMAYFNPKKPIIVRTEASFNEGLAAGLFQITEKGLQPVHYISRTLSKPERNYGQTEKDALAVAWAKERFKMYLLGAPRFRMITSHKPLIPMFMRATAKLSPRVEKWVMSMQDVDYILEYMPGKDEQDPLDFLSRHPLSETEEDETEAMVKAAIEGEHAVVLEGIREATMQDEDLMKLADVVKQSSWEKREIKNDPAMSSFYGIKDEIFMSENVLFRGNRIIIPAKLRKIPKFSVTQNRLKRIV